MPRGEYATDSVTDAAVPTALNPAVNASTTIPKIYTSLVGVVADSTEMTYWRDNARQEAEVEEAVIAFKQDLRVFYRRNRRRITLIARAYMRNFFLFLIFHLGFVLVQLVLFALFFLCIFIVRYILRPSSRMDRIFT